MTREDKYNLDRVLIELENAVQELVDYVRKKTFMEWFDNPVGQLDTFFGTLPRVYREAPCRKK